MCFERIVAGLLFYFLFVSVSSSNSQVPVKYTISGYVKDSASGEALIGATVYLKEMLKGGSANAYGFYSITVDSGSYTLVVSFLGYEEKFYAIHLDRDLRLNVELKDKSVLVQQVEITAEREDKNVQSTQMGKMELEVEQIKSLPAFLGEVDVLKAIQLLPGVQSAGEGNSGFYVRGGGPDQNLILLDEAVVYNAAHLFGFFSVFNSDAIKNVSLTKGGMPAQYGGRLASVLDITMKEGNNKKFEVEGGIGPIAGRITVQGPIKKDTSSFIISARRTFIDLFLREPFLDKNSDAYGNSYFFYDLNAKVNYRLSDKDRIFLSGYFGRDVFDFKNTNSGFTVNIPWGNATTSLRWNHLFSDKMFVNTSLIFSDYKFEFGAEQQEFEFRLFSGIRDWNGKIDFSYFPEIRHHVRFGTNYVYHTFTPSYATARSGDVVFDLGDAVKLYAHEGAVYISDDFDWTDKISLNGGIRYTLFEQVGPFNRFIKDEFLNTTDTIKFGNNEKVAFYHHVEPRFSVKYSLNSRSSVKASFSQNYQYVHLASLSSVTLPTDVWTPSSDLVQPQFGTQYALGYFRNFKSNTYETSVEVYYKDMQHQIEYREGAQPQDDGKNNQDNNFVFGKGWSYGLELFLKKSKGKFNGWIGYTLSYTKRKFPDINNGVEYYAKYDRTHDVSLVLTYEMNKKWTFGLTWIYATGNSLTLPQSRYFINGPIDIQQLFLGQYGVNTSNLLYEYTSRNAYRQPAYHRLDVSATLNGKKTKRFESSWNFSVFNLYSRMNPYFIYFNSEVDKETSEFKVQAKQVSLFPIIPSVTYNFKF